MEEPPRWTPPRASDPVPVPVLPPCVLVVDDDERNVRLLCDLLSVKRGYRTARALSGKRALALAQQLQPDLILLDVLMKPIDGFEVCRRLRSLPQFQATPIVMVTSLESKEHRVKGLEAGADDFLSKPVMSDELFARARSLLRMKAMYDELVRLSSSLKLRVQVGDERLARLLRFFAPQIAARLINVDADPLQSHRREVSVLFVDLRGFTAFNETQSADTVMGVLRDFHAAMGVLISSFEGTLERFTGDGLMVFFNDPDPVPDHALRAVNLGLAMCHAVAGLQLAWARHNGPSGIGIGIAKGVATLGPIGFESRLDYAAIGTVTNLASRLCGRAKAGEVLVSQDVWNDVQHLYGGQKQVVPLDGLSQPVACWRIVLPAQPG